MKKLFGRAKETAQTQERYDESGYEWDEASDGTYDGMAGEPVGDALEEFGEYMTGEDASEVCAGEDYEPEAYMDEDCAAEAYTGEDYEPEVYTGEGCAAEEPEEDPVYAMTEDQKTGAEEAAGRYEDAVVEWPGAELYREDLASADLPVDEPASWPAEAYAAPEEESLSWPTEAHIEPEEETSFWQAEGYTVPKEAPLSWPAEAGATSEEALLSWPTEACIDPEEETSSWSAETYTEPFTAPEEALLFWPGEDDTEPEEAGTDPEEALSTWPAEDYADPEEILSTWSAEAGTDPEEALSTWPAEDYADPEEILSTWSAEAGTDPEEASSWSEEAYTEEPTYGESGEDDSAPSTKVRQLHVIQQPPKQRQGKKPLGHMPLFRKCFTGKGAANRTILAAGVGVMALAVLVSGIFLATRLGGSPVSTFADVGEQLDGIDVIGEKGLVAVADAQIARLAAVVPAATPEPTEEPLKEYDEIDYDRQVAIVPDFTSIQKDLKIKFINKKNNKLVGNVPFSVMVTDPSGKTYIWSDDDMDGIIYKKGIAPGTYQVIMESLTDSKYADFTVSTASRSVEVKEEIVYSKVDVENEVKQETEINAAEEDTKKNETVVESTLEDTQTWVDSNVVGAVYSEISKSSIPDPATLGMSGQSVGMDQMAAAMSQTVRVLAAAGSQPGWLEYARAENRSASFSTTEPQDPSAESGQIPDSAQTPSTDHTQEPGLEETTEPVQTPGTDTTEEPIQTPEADVTADPTTEPTMAPTQTPGTDPTMAPTQTPGTDPTTEPTMAPTQAPGTDATTAPPQTPGTDATTAPTQDPTITPTTAPPVEPSVSPSADPSLSPSPSPSATPLPQKGTVTVDRTAMAGIVGAEFTAKASVSGFTEGMKVVYSVVSSDTAVATATVDGEGNISVKGAAAGTATVTVRANYENGADDTGAETSISVTIGGAKMLTLDKTSVTLYASGSEEIQAEVVNALSQDQAVAAESSDTRVALVSVDGRKITVSGVAPGSAVITVKYSENGEEVSASCNVTVKSNPMEDRSTLLKTSDGQQVFVQEGESYREAVFADYYTAPKFFVKGEQKYTGWQTIDGKVYYYTADGTKVVGEQIIQGAKYNFASDGSLITDNGVLGIDVSKWNGSIDWNAVKNSGISYVIIRSGYRGSSAGTLIVDPKFEANIKGASAVGLKVGIYFFSQAVDEIEAVEEASMVLGQIKKYTISYPVFIDVEASGGRGDMIDRATRTAVCKAFCQTIQNGGYTAGIYSNKTWLEEKIDAASLGGYKIWLAQYAAAPTYGGRYDLWQYTPSGSVSGISGSVDLNISYMGY